MMNFITRISPNWQNFIGIKKGTTTVPFSLTITKIRANSDRMNREFHNPPNQKFRPFRDGD